jgi:hypothetical protein
MLLIDSQVDNMSGRWKRRVDIRKGQVALLCIWLSQLLIQVLI